jgi:hypothetical protein
MRKLFFAMLCIAMAACTKQDVSVNEAVSEAARGGKSQPYLSEVYVNGKLHKKHIFENGRPVKTQTYSPLSGFLLSELVYQYFPESSKVEFTEMGYRYNMYYDAANRPVKMESFGYGETIPNNIETYSYNKDRIVRVETEYDFGINYGASYDQQYIYQGNWLTKVISLGKIRGAFPSEENYVYETKWKGPFQFSWFVTSSPSNIREFRFSPNIKSPEYNFAICHTGFAQPNGVSHKDLIKRKTEDFIQPSHGMLLLEQSYTSPTNSFRVYLENIKTDANGLPVSYDQVETSTFGSSTTTYRTSYSFKYISL